jgi:hypothetical protein
MFIMSTMRGVWLKMATSSRAAVTLRVKLREKWGFAVIFDDPSGNNKHFTITIETLYQLSISSALSLDAHLWVHVLNCLLFSRSLCDGLASPPEATPETLGAFKSNEYATIISIDEALTIDPKSRFPIPQHLDANRIPFVIYISICQTISTKFRDWLAL